MRLAARRRTVRRAGAGRLAGSRVACLTLAATLACSAPVAAGWSPAATMDAGRHAHTATLLASGKVLVAGGERAGRALASAELYDPATDAWRPAGRMRAARRSHAATLLRDGRVLVTGGAAGGRALAGAELYDPATNRWSAVPSMAGARERHTATLLANGNVLVVGGFDGARPLASAERYDPVARAWSRAPSLAGARGAHTATRLADGRVLVAGGFGAAGATTEADLYDAAGRTRTATAPMLGARESHTATLLGGGTVAVVGGDATEGPTPAVELYDPRAGAWRPASSMATARASHTTTLLATGRLLVSGGFAPGAVTASAEVYDPVAGVWSPAPGMAVARDQQTATRLRDGTVLLAGGFSGATGVASAERYTPRRATTITASAPGPIVIGAAVTAAATVGGQARRMTGEVRFEAFRPADATCSNVPGFIATVPIDAHGRATSKPFRPTAPGTWRWMASYSGDDASNDARSACGDPAAQLVVVTARPSLTTRPSAHAGFGPGPLAETARITGRLDPQPGATVAFRLYGPEDPTCLGPPAFASVVAYPSAGGTVTSAAFTPQAPGTYRWRATFSGDASNAAVEGPCGDPVTATWSLRRLAVPDA